MKTNVPVEMDDLERNMLAAVIDGKQSARKVSRKEVNDVVQGVFDSLLNRFEKAAQGEPERPRNERSELLRVDPEDRERLAGKSASYIIGWNKGKTRFRGRQK